MEPQLVNNNSLKGAADGIPRRIHQTWKTRDLPPCLSVCWESVIRLNPGWEYRFYTDDEIIDVVAATGEITKDDFLKIPSGIERSDAFKAAVLYLKGGIYCDIDIQAFQPFENILKRLPELSESNTGPELWLSPDHPIHCSRLFGYPALKNHFMIAKPGSRFLGFYLSRLSQKMHFHQLGGDPVHSTGPAFLTGLIRENGGTEGFDIGTIPSDWVNPLPDLTLDFPEILPYKNLVLKRQWIERLRPHLAHYWWHGYSGRGNMMDDYQEQLFPER